MCRQLLGPSASASSASHISSVNDTVAPYTHDTVSHDESMSDGPLSFRLFVLFINLSVSVAPYSILPSVIFMLTVYGVFPSVDHVSF